MITKINSTEGEGARRFSQSSATSRGSLASSTGAKAPAFLQSLKQSLTAECEAVAQKVVAVRDKLTEIERFAADDWQTTEGEVEKLKQRFESRKRKLAKSLMMVMDTQDSTPGFEPLPVLPGGRAPNMDYKKPISAEDALAALDADGDGIITADELIAVNEDNFNADAVIEEFTLRVENIETMKRQIRLTKVDIDGEDSRRKNRRRKASRLSDSVGGSLYGSEKKDGDEISDDMSSSDESDDSSEEDDYDDEEEESSEEEVKDGDSYYDGRGRSFRSSAVTSRASSRGRKRSGRGRTMRQLQPRSRKSTESVSKRGIQKEQNVIGYSPDSTDNDIARRRRQQQQWQRKHQRRQQAWGFGNERHFQPSKKEMRKDPATFGLSSREKKRHRKRIGRQRYNEWLERQRARLKERDSSRVVGRSDGPNRIQLYAFDEDVVKRVFALRNWKLAIHFAVAIYRLKHPLRRSGRAKQNWKKAVNVVNASKMFSRMGAERKLGRGDDMWERKGYANSTFFDDDGKGDHEEGWYSDDETDEEMRKRLREAKKWKDGMLTAAGAKRFVSHEQRKLRVRRRRKDKAQMAKEAAFRKSQAARKRWRRALGAAKCIVRMGSLSEVEEKARLLMEIGGVKQVEAELGRAVRDSLSKKGKGGFVPQKLLEKKQQHALEIWNSLVFGEEGSVQQQRLHRLHSEASTQAEDDEALEFCYDEKIDLTILMATESREIKVLAASRFNDHIEKQQKEDLKQAPREPGAGALVHAFKKRPKIDPRYLAEQKRQQAEAAALAQQMQLLELQRLHALSQVKKTSDGGTIVTKEKYKEILAKRKAKEKSAEEEEARRLDEEDKEFTYFTSNVRTADTGRTWEVLLSAQGRKTKLEKKKKKTDMLGMNGIVGPEEKDDNDDFDPDLMLEISPMDVAPSDPTRYAVWETVRSNRFETFILLAILCNCVQLTLYDPEVDGEKKAVEIFEPPFSIYGIFEIIFTFLFPLECALKLYAFDWLYFSDFWNKIDFFCVVLIFINLIPAMPNLTVIRTMRMLKPLRSISRLPTLKVIVTTLVRSSQQILDVYFICLCVYLVFAILAMDLFGGSFAQVCLKITEEHCACPDTFNLTSCDRLNTYERCESKGGMWEERIVQRQPDVLTLPLKDRRCGVYECEKGYKCYLGNLDEYNPEGGALNFDTVMSSMLAIFIIITRKGWISILHKLWDSYGYLAPSFILTMLLMFGSYLLTQLVTAAITVTYEKVDDERILETERRRKAEKHNRRQKRIRQGLDPDDTDDEEEKAEKANKDSNINVNEEKEELTEEEKKEKEAKRKKAMDKRRGIDEDSDEEFDPYDVSKLRKAAEKKKKKGYFGSIFASTKGKKYGSGRNESGDEAKRGKKSLHQDATNMSTSNLGAGSGWLALGGGEYGSGNNGVGLGLEMMPPTARARTDANLPVTQYPAGIGSRPVHLMQSSQSFMNNAPPLPSMMAHQASVMSQLGAMPSGTQMLVPGAGAHAGEQQMINSLTPGGAPVTWLSDNHIMPKQTKLLLKTTLSEQNNAHFRTCRKNQKLLKQNQPLALEFQEGGAPAGQLTDNEVNMSAAGNIGMDESAIQTANNDTGGHNYPPSRNIAMPALMSQQASVLSIGGMQHQLRPGEILTEQQVNFQQQSAAAWHQQQLQMGGAKQFNTDQLMMAQNAGLTPDQYHRLQNAGVLAGIVQKPRFIDNCLNKYFKRPEWSKWRGFKKLRFVTRDDRFNRIFYFTIFLNMYVMTASDVTEDPCMFSANDSANGTDYCYRGALIDTTRSDYILYDGINNLCALIFAFELIARFLSEGFRYFEDSFNLADAVVVVISLVDIWYDIAGASAAKFFRLANIAAKSGRVESLKKIINSIAQSLGPLSGVVSLAFIFLFVFAVGGLQLYGLLLPGEDRLNFRDFPNAIFTTFVMFTGDGWSYVMYKIMWAEDNQSHCIFFVIFIIYGMFGLSMLILATLISKFDCGNREDFKLSAVLPFDAISDACRGFILTMREGGARKRVKRKKMLEDMKRRGLLEDSDEEEDDGGKKEGNGSKSKDDKGDGKEGKEGADGKGGKGNAAGKKDDPKEKAVGGTAKGGAKEKPKTIREQKIEEAKEMYFIQKEHCFSQDHPSLILRKCAEDTAEQIRMDTTPEALNGPIGYWYFKIEPESSFRMDFVDKIVDRPWFENFIMVCILAACAMLAYEGPGLDKDDPMYNYFALADLAFLLIFVAECLLRICHKGFLFTNVAYLKDPWNQMDFFIVVTDCLSTVFQNLGDGFSNFRALRGFRALRPLRALKKAPELRAVVDVIANCMPVFINLAVCTVAFYAVGAVLMMKLFAGRFWKCTDPTITHAKHCYGAFNVSVVKNRYALSDTDWLKYANNIDGHYPGVIEAAAPLDESEYYDWDNSNILWSKKWPAYFRSAVTGELLVGEPFNETMAMHGEYSTWPEIPRKWYNAPRNFDSTSSAMLTLFELATLDHWVEVFYMIVDAPNKPGFQSTTKGESWPYGFFVIFNLIVGNYLFMNLLVCGVVVVYDKLKDDSRHNPELTRGQRELLDCLQLMIRTRPGYRQVPPELDDFMGAQRRVAYKVVMFDLGGKGRGTTFELIISLLVLANTVVMALYYFESPEDDEYILYGSDDYLDLQKTEWRANLDRINDIFTAIFVLEMLLKLTAFGFRNYWRDSWNKFDVVVVFASLIMVAVDGFMGISVVPETYTDKMGEYMNFDPKTLRVMRVVKLVRVVRLLKGLAKYPRIQAATQLIDTLNNCIKHMLNVFGLWMLVTITFALMSMSLFGTIEFSDGEVYKYGVVNEYTNFSTFPQALAALFKVATLDNWTWLMRDVMAWQTASGQPPFAWAFFVLYLIVTAFLFLNIFTAIVMDQYDFTARVTSPPRSNGVERQIMTFNQASTLSEEWGFLDPNRTDFIDEWQIRDLLSRIGPPIGFPPDADRARQLRHLRRLELRMTGTSRQVHYVDFFISCAVLRYRQQWKPILDLDLSKIKGKLSLELQLSFPTIMDRRLDDTGGLISAVQALYYLQGHYRGLQLRRMRNRGDWEGIRNYTTNRLEALERQAEKRQKEDEDSLKKAKGESADRGGRGGKKKSSKKKK